MNKFLNHRRFLKDARRRWPPDGKRILAICAVIFGLAMFWLAAAPALRSLFP